ncbi:hypothetical protein CWI80_10965 [Pseudidiomarina sediminum]|uniref:TIGR04219 family outer membrane beta-barrel protein n=1 Tax=Pseudidiomarina sediminum TaxID=431675 RepID=A0A432Z0M4_9GAMM|nr:TIGR04219 family outer membrane beta-barrel protein [Pseudidiomarina sediminum]MBY6064827.1 TIGR04219 family outer membrane beta-barrel protein [Pseudidiomarina sediminum]RUO69736.1 hypothetical protein CWI80_10965 [Pseudidiomarina sediminum]
MRKFTLARSICLVVAVGTATPAFADSIFGVYAGGQLWRSDNSGSFGTPATNPDFSFGKENLNSFYVALEHPIPLFPNAKIRHNELDHAGQQVLQQDYDFFGNSFAAGTALSYSTDFSHTDYTLYYELFDNDLVSFDLGVTAKRVDGLIVARSAQQERAVSPDGWIPTLYSQVRVGIPATPLTVYGLANAVSIDDSKVEDYEVGIEYRPIENFAVDVNLQLGYRVFNLELDDLDGVYSNLEYKGPYVGIEFHF